jgi:hypothetical protein
VIAFVPNVATDEEIAMADVSESIQQLEETIERAQAVLDHAQRALSTIESVREHAEGGMTTLRRAVTVVALGAAVVIGVMLLRRRLS